MVSGCELDFVRDALLDRRDYRVNCSKIAQALENFVPQWTARKGAAAPLMLRRILFLVSRHHDSMRP